MRDEPSLLWHTTPLHYLPYLLQTGAILSAAQLAAGQHPIRPRPTAIVRKTKLGLADYVHLSPAASTPLLFDKCKKGYPHALIAFDRTQISGLPGMALLKFNTKRWAHRDDFVPVTGETEKASLWKEYVQGKYPSLEVLIPGKLEILQAMALYFASEEEAEITCSVITHFRFPLPPIQVGPFLFRQDGSLPDLAKTRKYFTDCCLQNRILPPPDLPFD